VELLKHKGIAATYHPGSPSWLATPEALDRIAEGWRAIGPFNAWLTTHVGPAEAVEGDPRPARRGAGPRGAGV
jgi:hypothetical protein